MLSTAGTLTGSCLNIEPRHVIVVFTFVFRKIQSGRGLDFAFAQIQSRAFTGGGGGNGVHRRRRRLGAGNGVSLAFHRRRQLGVGAAFTCKEFWLAWTSTGARELECLGLARRRLLPRRHLPRQRRPSGHFASSGGSPLPRLPWSSARWPASPCASPEHRSPTRR